MSATARRSEATARSDRPEGARAAAAILALLTGAALLWSALLAGTPVWRAATAGANAPAPALAAGLVHLVGARVCHQRPERTFHPYGEPMAVCGRCTGLYLSGTAGLLVAWRPGGRRGVRARGARLRSAAASDATRMRPWWPTSLHPAAGWLALAAVPTLLTWTLEAAGVWNPGTPLRALAALPLGATAGWLLGRSAR